jgi:AraC-like DNA-binding protein
MGAQNDLAAIIASAGFVEQLFDRIPDVVFFVKDLEGRYRVVNSTLVERCGAASKTDLISRTATEVFPAPLGERYLEQDRIVVRAATAITLKLELHLYPNHLEGWCLTDKIPLMTDDGHVCGVAGISRDLQTPTTREDRTDDLGRAIELIETQPIAPPSVGEIAAQVGLSAYQLNRRFKDLLGITVRQLLTKTRVDVASRLLKTTSLAIGDVAQQSGYCDQSAFTRQFRRTTGLTPRQYRRRHRPPE